MEFKCIKGSILKWLIQTIAGEVHSPVATSVLWSVQHTCHRHIISDNMTLERISMFFTPLHHWHTILQLREQRDKLTKHKFTQKSIRPSVYRWFEMASLTSGWFSAIIRFRMWHSSLAWKRYQQTQSDSPNEIMTTRSEQKCIKEQKNILQHTRTHCG